MYKTLPSILKELRIKSKYTQKQLGDVVGVGQTTIANYEQGTRLPDADKLNKLADVFEVSIDYLIGRNEDNKFESLNTIYKLEGNEHKQYLNLLLQLNKDMARELITKLLSSSISMEEIYLNVLKKALYEVGRLWEVGEVDIWQEHYVSETTLEIMHEIKLKTGKKVDLSHTVISLNAGYELHNIGIRMISDLLEVNGWKVIYLGNNIPLLNLINAIESKKPEAIIISVTMPFHIEATKNMITGLRNHFGRKCPKIIVGGAAFINEKDICSITGADIYSVTVDDIKLMLNS